MKRLLFTVILFLLLGAIVNVTVAWSAAWLWYGADGRWRSASYVADSGQAWRIGRVDGFGVTHMVAVQISVGVAARNTPDWADDGMYPNWSNWPHDLGSALRAYGTMVQASGWPLRSMRAEGVGREWTSGILLAARRSPMIMPRLTSVWPPGILPTEIVWPGFAINTVFYALILWLLFAAPFALRRRRRIKRGLCPKCAYPVGTNDVCTECGAPAPQAVKPTASTM